MQILTAYHPFQNDNHHTVVMIKLSRYLSIILLTIQTKYFPTNTIIYCQNVLLLYCNSLDDGRTPEAGKQDQCPFHSHGSSYKQILLFFVFLVPVFEAPLHSKVALLVFVFGRM